MDLELALNLYKDAWLRGWCSGSPDNTVFATCVYLAGNGERTQEEIAERFGISSVTIRNLVKKIETQCPADWIVRWTEWTNTEPTMNNVRMRKPEIVFAIEEGHLSTWQS